MIRFRRGTVTDAEMLSVFARRLFDEVFSPDNKASDMAVYMERAFSPDVQAQELADPARVCLIGEDEGVIASYALLRVGNSNPSVSGESPVEIERFYVDFPWHGTGAAQEMMVSVCDTARSLRGLTLWLGVWEQNKRAIRFYTKRGFVDVGSHPFMLGTDMQTDRVMAQALEPLPPIALQKVSLPEAFARFSDHWSPRVAGELNGQHVKLAKFHGAFLWHHHEHEDELFLVHRGSFRMEFRDSVVQLVAGDFLIVPRGVEHRPVADEEVEVVLFEPAGTLNTGNVRNERTIDDPLALDTGA